MNLCDECAKKKGINISIDENAMGKTSSNAEDEKYKDLKCPRCGLPYLEFKAKGWLGCFDCYFAFEKEIDELLVRVHGSSVHKGKQYCRFEIPGKQIADIRQLRQKLSKAVHNEEFELAAELRDAIKQLNRH